ncbi:PREDICTED: phosphatidylinositol/phosphatidylcholine transfer protein SFH6-like isoform X2 [Nelumbo nucifera]|uniref:Phosphatidylinositol/phosphatidylcholine transfer protein SFH6-like isoform X2 n=1 Tax=Nelumbo nucifera TaxID=4432 RepID=A0A1U8B6V2_NELNU|nr:PREDICTED: phosphatidylinositol/phosphatidylcholine transfer protein SFH6-like isoform X2 [Nelumbo nucifera]
MEKHQETAVSQMRKSVEKLGSSTQNYGAPTLLRFLIARRMDPEKAAKMFVQWQNWRAEFVPLGFIPESEIPDELNARKIYLQGLSKDGHPVLIIKASKHLPSKDHLQLKRFVVHLLDKTIASSIRGREIGNEKLIGILDLQQITVKNIDARALITGFQFLQIVIVTNEKERKAFIMEIGEDTLPEEYGGKAKLVALQDVKLSHSPSQN